MKQDFDQFPVYDPIIAYGTGNMSSVWIAVMTGFYTTLISYLSSVGIYLPQLTTLQRDSLASPQNGQMIYNTTLGTAQYFKAGAWVSF